MYNSITSSQTPPFAIPVLRSLISSPESKAITSRYVSPLGATRWEMRFFHSSSHNSLLLLFKPPAGNNKSSEVWIVSSPKYTPFDDGVTTALSPIEVYFWLITTTVDKLIISSPPLKGISCECKLKITLSNSFMEIWMGGGTLHLKVPRRGGGRLKQFQKSGWKVVEREGVKKLCLLVGWGVWIFAGITHFKSDCSSGRNDTST